MKIHFISNPCLIEGTEWRLTVVDFWIIRGKKRVYETQIQYQWRQSDAALWSFERTWPGYKVDAVSNGLPPGLDVLLEANYSLIAEFIEKVQPEPEAKSEAKPQTGQSQMPLL